MKAKNKEKSMAAKRKKSARQIETLVREIVQTNQGREVSAIFETLLEELGATDFFDELRMLANNAKVNARLLSDRKSQAYWGKAEKAMAALR